MRYEFQFHKGTIRTNAATLVTAAKLKFQFHKGTIRTLGLMVGIMTLSGFNSIKVRLEL